MCGQFSKQVQRERLTIFIVTMGNLLCRGLILFITYLVIHLCNLSKFVYLFTAISPGGSQNNVHLYTSIEAMMNSTYTQLRNVSKTSVPVDDIVNGILYLASDQATMVNGFNFVANCCCCRCFSDELRAFYYINGSNNSGKCSKFF